MESSRRDLSVEEEVIRKLKEDRRRRRLNVLRGRMEDCEGEGVGGCWWEVGL